MNMVYLRKLFPHDITHEVSVTTRVVRDFFDGETHRIKFYREDGIRQYFVDINSAKDLRLGGDFKLMYANDLVEAGDLLVVLKQDRRYSLYVVKQSDENFGNLNALFDSRRHVVLNLNTEETISQRSLLFSSINTQCASTSRDGRF